MELPALVAAQHVGTMCISASDGDAARILSHFGTSSLQSRAASMKQEPGTTLQSRLEAAARVRAAELEWAKAKAALKELQQADAEDAEAAEDVETTEVTDAEAPTRLPVAKKPRKSEEPATPHKPAAPAVRPPPPETPAEKPRKP
eukprot:418157-Lingulodinium_polyedra.AAC.1